jgi:hypothetical protein
MRYNNFSEEPKKSEVTYNASKEASISRVYTIFTDSSSNK